MTDEQAIQSAVAEAVPALGVVPPYDELVAQLGEDGAFLFYDTLAEVYRQGGGNYREASARVLYAKAYALATAGKHQEALAGYEEVRVHLAPDLAGAALYEAMVLFNEGKLLRQLRMREEALLTYDTLHGICAGAEDPGVRRYAALALLEKTNLLFRMGQLRESFAVSQELADIYGSDPDPAVRKVVDDLRASAHLVTAFRRMREGYRGEA